MNYRNLLRKSIYSFLLFVILPWNTNLAQNLDINLLRSIYTNRSKCLDPSFKFLSKTATPISIGVPLTIFAIGIFNKDKDQRRQAMVTGIAITSAMTISTILKYTINRPRPYQKYSDIYPLAKDFTPSFPSGHTTSAFCTATTLSLMYRKWYVIVPSYTWASLVGYSRLHMGMHYPLDVLAGAIIGMGTSFLTYKLMKKYY